MRARFTPLRAARMLELVREVDLGAIREEAEARFSVLLSGDELLVAALAEGLSATPGRSGRHPYLRTDAHPEDLPNHPPHPDLHIPDIHIIVQPGLEARPAQPPAAARVPTLVVCVLAGEPLTVGAELPRPGESARVIVSDLGSERLRERVIPALLRAAPPRLHLTLARQLPACRPSVIRALIEDGSRTNALYAASTGVAQLVPLLNLPLGVADTVVLTKNQLLMAYKVALATGKTGHPQELITEIIGVLGGGLLFRQVARGLVGLIPVWGLLPKVAVAYAGTQVIGTATALWATEGRTLTLSEVQGLYRSALGRGRALAGRLVAKARAGRAEVLPDAEAPALGAPPRDETDEQPDAPS